MTPKAIKAMRQATSQSWARANKLSKLADIAPSIARNFLSNCEEEQKALLDNGRRNSRALQDLVCQAQDHAGAKTLSQQAHGVPEAYRSSCGGAIASGLVGVTKDGETWFAEPEPAEQPTKMPQVPLDLLFDLKNLIDKYDVDTVTQGLGTLLYLRNDH